MGKPIYIKVEKQLDQPLSKVWEAVALGFGNVASYNKALKASRLDSEITSGIGMQRHCDFPKKGHIKEEIIEWAENKSFKLKFTESSVPLAVMESKFTFQDNKGKTILIQEFWYRMKAPMGFLSGMMKGKMKKTLVTGLDGLENYLNKEEVLMR